VCTPLSVAYANTVRADSPSGKRDCLGLLLQRTPNLAKHAYGAALQLALFRHPAMTMAQVLNRSATLPEELVTFIAEQLDLRAEALADYASRDQTMTDHARELAAALGLRCAARTDVSFMIEAATKAAWATDKGIVIAAGGIDALRQARILIPSVSTVERAGSAGRARARKQAAHAVLSGLRPEQLDALDVFLITDPNKGVTPLTWLKAIPTAVKPDHVRDILDRLCQVREIGIPAKLSTLVHPDRYRQFVCEGRASPAYLIERYTVLRRQPTLVACLIDLEERLTDAAIEMADKLIGMAFSRAKNTQARRYAATLKDVARLMRLVRGTIEAPSTALDNDSDPIEMVDETVGWATLLRARHEVEAFAETVGVDPLTVAADRYATLRKFASTPLHDGANRLTALPLLPSGLSFRARGSPSCYWQCRA